MDVKGVKYKFHPFLVKSYKERMFCGLFISCRLVYLDESW